MLVYKSAILVDGQGRITLPSKVRDALGLVRGSMLVLELEGTKITLEIGEKKDENEN